MDYIARTGAMARRGRSELSKPCGHQTDEMRGLILEERAPVVKPPLEDLQTVALTGSRVGAIFTATVFALLGSVALPGGLAW